MAAQGIEHFRHRLGQVHLEGMVLHLLAGSGKDAHGGVGLGGGSVAAARYRAVFHVHHALFGDANEAAGLLHAGEHIFHHGAAFVHHHGGGDVMVFKILHDVFGAVAVDFLAAGEGEVDVKFRLEALADQVIGSGQNAVDGDLGIQGAPAPEHTVFQNGGEGGLQPQVFVHGNHIVVGHQYGGVALLFAVPAQQQAPVRQLVKGTDIEYPGIQAGQQGDQLLEFCIVLQRVVVIGYGLAAHQLGKGLYRGVLVEFHRGFVGFRLGLGGEPGGADQHHGKKGNDYCENQVTQHITALLSYTGSGPWRW